MQILLLINLLSNFMQHEDNKKDGNIIVTKMKKSVEIMAKPRMALSQGREDDESMACRVIQFGSFSIDPKQIKMTHERELDSTLALSSRIFVGNNLVKKYWKARKATNISETSSIFHEGKIHRMNYNTTKPIVDSIILSYISRYHSHTS